MNLLAQALRDELIATRYRAGLSSTRDVTRALGRDPDDGTSGHPKLWKFERGNTGWPRDVDEHVAEYAQASNVEPLAIWIGTARRWQEALSEGIGATQGRRIARQARESQDGS